MVGHPVGHFTALHAKVAYEVVVDGILVHVLHGLDYQAYWAARGTLLGIKDRKSRSSDAEALSGLIASCYPQRLFEILNHPANPADREPFGVNSLLSLLFQ